MPDYTLNILIIFVIIVVLLAVFMLSSESPTIKNEDSIKTNEDEKQDLIKEGRNNYPGIILESYILKISSIVTVVLAIFTIFIGIADLLNSWDISSLISWLPSIITLGLITVILRSSSEMLLLFVDIANDLRELKISKRNN